jgi:hypothetical protein
MKPNRHKVGQRLQTDIVHISWYQIIKIQITFCSTNVNRDSFYGFEEKGLTFYRNLSLI